MSVSKWARFACFQVCLKDGAKYAIDRQFERWRFMSGSKIGNVSLPRCKRQRSCIKLLSSQN